MKGTTYHILVPLASGMLLGTWLPTVYAAETCVKNDPEDKQVCASVPGHTPPNPVLDFIVTYDANDDNPDVALIEGNTWTVYSEVVSTGVAANIGDIFIHEDADTGDTFTLTVKNGTGNGADDVGSMDLDGAAVSGWTGWSSIQDSLIGGNVSGDIEVSGNGTTGGKLIGITIISGGVSGKLIAEAIEPDPALGIGLFTVSGSVSDTIDIGTIAASQTVTITGVVTDPDSSDTDEDVTIDALAGTFQVNGVLNDSNLRIRVADLNGSGTLKLNGGQWFTGELILENGIDDANGEVFINFLDGTVDLNDKDVDGDLLLAYTRASGEVVNGGAITGSVLFGYNSQAASASFGSAEFSSIALGGSFSVLNVDFSGDLTIDHDVAGELNLTNSDLDGSLSIGGDLASTSDINIDGGVTANGELTIDGECEGDIVIDTSTASGSLIHLAGGLASTGTVIVNDGEGNYNAGGTITVGSLSGNPVGGNYDGQILIRDETGSCTGTFGDLDGVIRIAVCDDDENDHYICVEGDIDGSITKVDATCQNPAPDTICLGCQ